MGYEFEGFIASLATWEAWQRHDPSLKVCPLPFELGLMPGTVVPGFGVDARACGTRLAERGVIAFIEASEFGDQGGSSAVLFENGSAVDVPVDAALRRLGVTATSGQDEFDTLGLGRNTRRWQELLAQGPRLTDRELRRRVADLLDSSSPGKPLSNALDELVGLIITAPTLERPAVARALARANATVAADDPYQAQLVALARGYVGDTPIPPRLVVESLHPGLEAALAANPTDEATWKVYVDALLELNHPLGDWMQRNHAGLISPNERDVEVCALVSRDITRTPPMPRCELHWRFGFIADAVVKVANPDLVERLATHPLAKFLVSARIQATPETPVTRELISRIGALPWPTSLRELRLELVVDEPELRADLERAWAALAARLPHVRGTALALAPPAPPPVVQTAVEAGPSEEEWLDTMFERGEISSERYHERLQALRRPPENGLLAFFRRLFGAS